MRIKSSFRSKDSFFFEDKKYVAKRTCSGEWGGTIWFKNKADGIMHSCASTCPVCINQLNGKYYLTNTLAHLSGFSQILEVDNPDSMNVTQPNQPGRMNGQGVAKYAADNESKSMKGARVMVDSVGILTLASFPYHGELYHIITDFQKTFVAKIVGGRFVTLDTVSNVSIWTYNPIVIRTIDNHFIVFFENDVTKGYIDIFDNKISLYRSTSVN